MSKAVGTGDYDVDNYPTQSSRGARNQKRNDEENKEKRESAMKKKSRRWWEIFFQKRRSLSEGVSKLVRDNRKIK